jgi:hypothetical protein
MIADPLTLTGWRSGWNKPDRRPIFDWANDPRAGIVLPASYAQPGRFDVGTSRHMIRPFLCVQDDRIREATWCGAIQTGKSLISEICIAWAIVNSPGPIMWTMQTDDDAKEHCNQRFMEMLRTNAHIRDIMPQDRHKQTMTEIYFGPFFLVVNGANLNNLQRVSVRWKFNSEVWLWKQGLLSHARGRVSAFEKAGNSKVVNESQGGNVGDDMDLAYRAGSQEVWSVKCFGCGALSPLEFAETAKPENIGKTCVVWNADARREDGSWNVGRAAETCRWVCPKCGHEHDNSAKTRARWNAEGDYLRTNPDAPADTVSFRWEGLVARDMGAMTAQFLEARRQQKMGVVQAMQDFTRQRRALPWKDDDDAQAVTILASGYTINECTAEKIENESMRFMTVDRQRDHFWCLVRAWRADGTSRLLYRSRVETVDGLEAIREKFGVEPQLVFEDSGYQPDGAYSDAAKLGWTTVKGSGENWFNVESRGVKMKRLWSQIVHVQHSGKLVPLIHWASDPIKDILHKLRSGAGAKWEIPQDAGEEYHKQMAGEVKRERINKNTGRPENRWVRTNANHYFDCEAMQVAAALMMRVLASPEPAKEDAK